MAESSDHRTIEWWPNEDRRCIVVMRRTPENDAMTDEELIAEFGDWPATQGDVD